MWSLISVLVLISALSSVVAVVYMCSMSAQRSGWRVLAERYKLKGAFEGRRLYLRSAVLNGFAFHGTLGLGADQRGLLLVPALPVRPFHPPLHLPWADLEGRLFERTFSNGLDLTLDDSLGRELDLRLEIAEPLRQELIESCDASWASAISVLRGVSS